jgi:thioredoxin reductase (NADPH)
VHGTRHVEGVTVKNAKDGGEERLEIGAVFVFIGAEPMAAWLPDMIARDKLGYLLTGADAVKCGRWPLTTREPCPLETTLPGVLAAGDIRSGSTKRVGFAVGDGSLAVTCAHQLRSYAHA